MSGVFDPDHARQRGVAETPATAHGLPTAHDPTFQMEANPHPSVPHRTGSTRQAPRTLAGLVVGLVLSAAVPLALVALAYPALTATLLVVLGTATAVLVERE